MAKIFARCALILLSTLLGSVAHAAGFQINEQSATLLGTALAGSAVSKDSNAVFFNPAAMSFVDAPEISTSVIGIFPQITFNPLNATDANGNPLSSSNNARSPARDALIPGFFAVYPINKQLSVGIGSTAPFGLKTDYDDNSFARYFATKSSITSFDITPALAIKPLDNLSFGFGLDFVYAKAELDQDVDATNLFYLFDPVNGVIPLFNGDLLVKNVASHWGMGWHMGTFWQVSPETDIGFSYHSRIKLNLKGDRTIDGFQNELQPDADAVAAGLAGLINSSVVAPLTLPDYGTVSLRQGITPWWDILADVSYTDWKVLQNITLNFGQGLPPSVTPLNYRNTWRVSVGQVFQVTPKLKFRMGLTYDETPVTDEFIDARLPDANRIWATVGTNIKLSPHLDMDLAYAHIFFQDAHINQSTNFQPLAGIQSLQANYSANANLFGMQLNYRFNA